MVAESRTSTRDGPGTGRQPVATDTTPSKLPDLRRFALQLIHKDNTSGLSAIADPGNDTLGVGGDNGHQLVARGP